VQERQNVLVMEIFQHPEHRLLPLKAPPPWVLEIPPPTSCAARRLRGSQTDAPTVVQQPLDEVASVLNAACKQHSELSEETSRHLGPPRRPSPFTCLPPKPLNQLSLVQDANSIATGCNVSSNRPDV